MTATTITPEINSALNEVKKLLLEKLQHNIYIQGEFVANTNQNKDYLAFINFYNAPGLGNNAVTHHTGIELSALNDPAACVKLIMNEINQQNLMGIFI